MRLKHEAEGLLLIFRKTSLIDVSKQGQRKVGAEGLNAQ